MEKTKKDYETTFIVNASLDDTQIDPIIAKFQEQITSYGGEIVAINKWGRKRLAYPIKKKNNGFYTHIEFKAPAAAVQQLEKFFKLDENILRFLTIQLDKKALKAKEMVPVKEEEIIDFIDPVIDDLKEPLFDDDEKDEERI